MTQRSSTRHQRDYSPVSWTEHFDEALDVTIDPHEDSQRRPDSRHADDPDSFRVYLRNFREPFAPDRQPGQRADPDKLELSQDELSRYSQVPTLVCLHGGGYSALTWAQFGRQIEQQCKCRLLAIDLRAHGDTKTADDARMDIDTLVSDVVAVINSVHQLCGFPETPKLVLIGHSMGGAIAVKCAAQSADSLPSLAGFVVIDVVEGTAKDALPLMMSVIKTRPTKFPSLSNAIEWSVRSGMAKNSDAARVSMPGNLVRISDGFLAIHDVPVAKDERPAKSRLLQSLKRHEFSVSSDQLVGQSLPTAIQHRPPLPSRVASLRGTNSMPPPPPPGPLSTTRAHSIEEEEAENTDQFGNTHKKACRHDCENETSEQTPDLEVSTTQGAGYAWRTNLAKTQPYWNGWFDGLSAQMLEAPVQGKFLLLAGIDRLDKSLTIGHMQGKFMMKVLPKCGHAVQEDVPDQVALAISDFLVRNKFTRANTD